MDTELEQEAEGEDITQPSQPYTICLDVLTDGTFSIHQEPLTEPSEESEAAEPSSMSQSATNLTDALKQVVKLYKLNPIGQDQQAEYEAGIQSGPIGKLSR